MRILPLPGSENTKLINGFGISINMSWFPIVSTCLSVIGIITGALWIVRPVVKETNFVIGKLTFLPIFFFRMCLWLVFLILLHSFSAFIFIAFAGWNMILLLLVQEDLGIDPFSHSLLSLIFPVHKMPSLKINSKISLKILFWMVFAGNSVLLMFHTCLYSLFYFKIYNPWCNADDIKLLIPMEKYQNINPLVGTLFVASTLPIILIYLVQSQRYFTDILMK